MLNWLTLFYCSYNSFLQKNRMKVKTIIICVLEIGCISGRYMYDILYMCYIYMYMCGNTHRITNVTKTPPYIHHRAPLSTAQRSLTCTFGDNLVSAPLSFRSGLLLNTANRSACFGIATTWNVCYSASATDPISTTHLGVYRPSAAVSGFTLVSASNFTVPRVGNASSYSCIRLPLSKERQFLVQPGDVVAVCLRYIGNGRLGLVGTQTSNILGNEGINCLSPGLAMPPIVSQSMGAYLLNLIPHVNLGKCRAGGWGSRTQTQSYAAADGLHRQYA